MDGPAPGLTGDRPQAVRPSSTPRTRRSTWASSTRRRRPTQKTTRCPELIRRSSVLTLSPANRAAASRGTYFGEGRPGRSSGGTSAGTDGTRLAGTGHQPAKGSLAPPPGGRIRTRANCAESSRTAARSRPRILAAADPVAFGPPPAIRGGPSWGMATIRDKMGHCCFEAGRDRVSRESAPVPQGCARGHTVSERRVRSRSAIANPLRVRCEPRFRGGRSE